MWFSWYNTYLNRATILASSIGSLANDGLHNTASEDYIYLFIDALGHCWITTLLSCCITRCTPTPSLIQYPMKYKRKKKVTSRGEERGELEPDLRRRCGPPSDPMSTPPFLPSQSSPSSFYSAFSFFIQLFYYSWFTNPTAATVHIRVAFDNLEQFPLILSKSYWETLITATHTHTHTQAGQMGKNQVCHICTLVGLV